MHQQKHGMPCGGISHQISALQFLESISITPALPRTRMSCRMELEVFNVTCSNLV